MISRKTPGIAADKQRCSTTGCGPDHGIGFCREYGLPDPVLRYDDSGFWVEFVGKHMARTTQKTTRKILSVLKENPAATRKEIAAILGNITEDVGNTN